MASALRTLYAATVDPPRVTQVWALNRRAATALGLVVVASFFGLQLFRGLALQDLSNDEAIYSYAVDSILESGGWLAPESSPQTAQAGDPAGRTEPFLEKPPLKFWIVALPITLGFLPLDEFGLRFWDALLEPLSLPTSSYSGADSSIRYAALPPCFFSSSTHR